MTRPAFRAPLILAAMCASLLAVTGCSSLLDGGEAPSIYAPAPAIQPDPSWPSVPWQLVVSANSAASVTDSQRIAVRPVPNELQVYKGASWARRPTEMLEDALMRTLEDSGKIGAVARPGTGINADYRLVLDLRRFESDYRGDAVPAAVVEVNAKLLHATDDRVVASRTFMQAEPAAGTAVPQAVSAFEQSLAQVSRELAGWVLTSGQAHHQQQSR
ncbi:ABC-type transport auxiliary lipoprotein family protein [Lysobacter korlensis]|uniref:ABC-type transport auxiliary lipoprotein family protein n=1 Tax=Lysobacter korlensis TaxID=553636 RepID=A0ABV6RIS2_9GAMM